MRSAMRKQQENQLKIMESYNLKRNDTKYGEKQRLMYQNLYEMLKEKLERAEKKEASRLSGIPEKSGGLEDINESLKEKQEEEIEEQYEEEKVEEEGEGQKEKEQGTE